MRVSNKQGVVFCASAALGFAILLGACPAPLEGPPEKFVSPFQPGAPSVGVSNQRLIVNWDSAVLAEKYNVYCGTSQTPGAEPVQTTAGTGTVITGLTNDTTYYVWVRAVNEHGPSPLSERAEGKPFKLAAPVVSDAVPANGSLTVTWAPVSGAASYDVYYRAVNTVPDTPVQTGITETSAVIPGLSFTMDSAHYVWVRAVNEYDSELSDAKEVLITLDAPNSLSLTGGDCDLTVNWEAVTNADSYKVYLNTTNTVPGIPAETGTTGTNTTIRGLTNGVTYYVWIQAVNTFGGSEVSATAQVTLLEKAITGFSFTNPPATGVINEAARTISVTVPCGTDRSSLTPTIATSPGATVSPLSGQAQNFTGQVIYTVTDSDNSSAQYAVTVTVAAPAVPEPVITPLNGALVINWAAVAGAVSYDVYCGTGTTIPETKNQTVTAPTSTATISGLTNGTVYNVWVKAKAADGRFSAPNSMVSGVPATIGGLYHTAVSTANKIPGIQNLNDALTWISDNATTGKNYFIILGADESLAPQTLSYSGRMVRITLLGEGSRTVTLSGNGPLFTVSNYATLVLDSGITLKGHGSNDAPLVWVNSGGTLIMRDNAVISGNTFSDANSLGGGVHCSGGTFTMEGGEISGNTASRGGGVHCPSGTFTMEGGTISGNTSSSSGGGVYVYNDSFGGVLFIKKGGTIYGDTDTTHTPGDTENTSTDGYGHAVNLYSGKKRNPTAGPGVYLYAQYSGSSWTYSGGGVGDTTLNWE